MQAPEVTAAPPPNKWQHPATNITKPPIQPKPPTALAHIATTRLTETALIATTGLMETAPKAWEGMAATAKPRQPKLHHEAAVTTAQQA